jgi:hypothetical protein
MVKTAVKGLGPAMPILELPARIEVYRRNNPSQARLFSRTIRCDVYCQLKKRRKGKRSGQGLLQPRAVQMQTAPYAGTNVAEKRTTEWQTMQSRRKLQQTRVGRQTQLSRKCNANCGKRLQSAANNNEGGRKQVPGFCPNLLIPLD